MSSSGYKAIYLGLGVPEAVATGESWAPCLRTDTLYCDLEATPFGYDWSLGEGVDAHQPFLKAGRTSWIHRLSCPSRSWETNLNTGVVQPASMYACIFSTTVSGGP